MRNLFLLFIVSVACSGCLINTHKDASGTSLFNSQQYTDLPQQEQIHQYTDYSGQNPNAVTVPEPATALLFAAGVPFFFRKKKQ